jgi:hypothetical protein
VVPRAFQNKSQANAQSQQASFLLENGTSCIKDKHQVQAWKHQCQ